MQIFAGTLTKDSVSIQSDEYGMRSYINSTQGRLQLEAECPADIIQAVKAVWGDIATVDENLSFLNQEKTTVVTTSPDAIQSDSNKLNTSWFNKIKLRLPIKKGKMTDH